MLSIVGKKAEVHVAELLPEVIEWNRQFLMKVNGALLSDRRAKVFHRGCFRIIRRAQTARYDAILLDVDNGPTAFVRARNAQCRRRRGFNRIPNALQPGGRVALVGDGGESVRRGARSPGFSRSRGRGQIAMIALRNASNDASIYVGETRPRQREAA